MAYPDGDVDMAGPDEAGNCALVACERVLEDGGLQLSLYMDETVLDLFHTRCCDSQREDRKPSCIFEWGVVQHRELWNMYLSGQNKPIGTCGHRSNDEDQPKSDDVSSSQRVSHWECGPVCGLVFVVTYLGNMPHRTNISLMLIQYYYTDATSRSQRELSTMFITFMRMPQVRGFINP